MQLKPFAQAGAALVLALSIAACSSAATPVPTVAPRASAATASATSADSSGAAASQGVAASQALRKANANTATQAEIAAALQANGVANPANWAKEVVEYRPYDTSDPTLRKLQDNLAKYKPDAATLAGILATLVP